MCVLSLISDKQLGFRAGHSTSDALTYIAQLHNAIDETSRTDNYTRGISEQECQTITSTRQTSWCTLFHRIYHGDTPTGVSTHSMVIPKGKLGKLLYQINRSNQESHEKLLPQTHGLILLVKPERYNEACDIARNKKFRIWRQYKAECFADTFAEKSTITEAENEKPVPVCVFACLD